MKRLIDEIKNSADRNCRRLPVLCPSGIFLDYRDDGLLFSFRSPVKDSSLAAGARVGEPITHRVVFILIDALLFAGIAAAAVRIFARRSTARG